MENTGLNQILEALKLHGEHVNAKFDEMKKQMDERFEQVDRRFEQMDERFKQMDKRFDRMEKKLSGIRVDLSETQETVDFLSSKSAQHEKKLRIFPEQHD
ncbi:hypothetical protein [Aquibacillus salsiterrae]|uniref:t-SNARE coiled-coil homology domain-containing protein n=1 Tax=Aquibacillus salsiterrae TaxID=2950439 RepID=A0A9X3WHE7_9BACI|nr:hypothetical protein [Aquibacillus salsiterrae]MDC3418476.1 hypothetical protein [Aquibacillus salsiterrae]